MASDPGGLPAVLVEAYSSAAGAGNGAAVVLLREPMQAAWMQRIARSLAQSETAFLLEAEQGWLLRWFTPSCEVKLCGHATLAALLALGHWGRLRPGEGTGFHTRSGVLEVALEPLRPGWGSLLLPSPGLVPQPPPPPLRALLQRHGLGEAEGFWTSSALGYSVALLSPTAQLEAMAAPAAELEGPLRNGLVLMQSLQAGSQGLQAAGPRNPKPRSEALPATAAQARASQAIGASGPVPPALAGEAADYQLRFFAPGLGIAEDPVTGSAHALVAPWWQKRLGRARVVGWQCSDRPGGMVCEAASSGMIRLFGSGHLLWDGILRSGSDGPAAPACDACDACDGEASGSAELWSAWRTATHCG
jgi:predicted PhzF superfamily epimerase YddE/YHI9